MLICAAFSVGFTASNFCRTCSHVSCCWQYDGTGIRSNAATKIMAKLMQPRTELHTFPAKKSTDLCLKEYLRLRKLVRFFCDPYIECWQNEDAQSQVGNQAAHDDDRKWALRVRPDRVRQRCWQ